VAFFITFSLADQSVFPSINPFSPYNKDTDVSLSIKIKCLDDFCQIGKKRTIKITLETPCDFAGSILTISGTSNSYFGLTSTTASSDKVTLLRIGDEIHNNNDVNGPKRLIFESNVEFQFLEQVQNNDFLLTNIIFTNLVSIIYKQCPLVTDPLYITMRDIDIPTSEKTLLTMPINLSMIGARYGTPVEIANRFSTLTSSLTNSVEKPEKLTLTTSFTIDDVKTGYLGPFQIVPTGLSGLFFTSYFEGVKCRVFDFETTKISAGTDSHTGVSFFSLTNPSSNRFQSSLVMDQFTLDCTFESKDGIDKQIVLNLFKRGDFGFALVVRPPLCLPPPLASLYDPICSMVTQFFDLSTRPAVFDEDKFKNYNSFSNFVETKYDLQKKIDFSQGYSQSKSRYYFGVPKTMTVNNEAITANQGFVQYSIPLPAAVLNKAAFTSPADLGMNLHLNAYNASVYQTASYFIDCIEETPQNDHDGANGDSKSTIVRYLSGKFASHKDKEAVKITLLNTRLTVHSPALKEQETVLKQFPEINQENPVKSCSLIVSIYLIDQVSVINIRTKPLPNIIFSYKQTFTPVQSIEDYTFESNTDHFTTVHSHFAIPPPSFDKFSSPHGFVSSEVIHAMVSHDTKESTKVTQFQLRNSQSYHNITRFIVDISNPNYSFQWPSPNSIKVCQVELDNGSSMDVQIELVDLQTFVVDATKFPIQPHVLAIFTCPSLTVVGNDSEGFPTLTVTTDRDRYAGALKGPDVKEVLLRQKTKRLLTYIVAAGFVGFLGFIVILCVLKHGCKKRKQKKQRRQAQLNYGLLEEQNIIQ
jgi:hypothetical protein